MVMYSQLAKFSTLHVRPMHIIPLPNLFLASDKHSIILVFMGLGMVFRRPMIPFDILGIDMNCRKIHKKLHITI